MFTKDNRRQSDDVTTSADDDSGESSDNSTSTMSEDEDIEDGPLTAMGMGSRTVLEAKGSLHSAQSYNKPVDNDQSKSFFSRT